MKFEINGINWTVVYVDAGNRLLTRSDGSRSVAVTDANTKCVYVSNLLYGAFYAKCYCTKYAMQLCFLMVFIYRLSRKNFFAILWQRMGIVYLMLWIIFFLP